MSEPLTWGTMSGILLGVTSIGVTSIDFLCFPFTARKESEEEKAGEP